MLMYFAHADLCADVFVYTHAENYVHMYIICIHIHIYIYMYTSFRSLVHFADLVILARTSW